MLRSCRYEFSTAYEYIYIHLLTSLLGVFIILSSIFKLKVQYVSFAALNSQFLQNQLNVTDLLHVYLLRSKAATVSSR